MINNDIVLPNVIGECRYSVEPKIFSSCHLSANMLFGLGGTQELSLPMLTVLRRFSILMTMIGEFYILHVVANVKVQLSVYMMIFGAVVAALNDLAFNMKVLKWAPRHAFLL